LSPCLVPSNRQIHKFNAFSPLQIRIPLSQTGPIPGPLLRLLTQLFRPHFSFSLPPTFASVSPSLRPGKVRKAILIQPKCSDCQAEGSSARLRYHLSMSDRFLALCQFFVLNATGFLSLRQFFSVYLPILVFTLSQDRFLLRPSCSFPFFPTESTSHSFTNHPPP